MRCEVLCKFIRHSLINQIKFKVYDRKTLSTMSANKAFLEQAKADLKDIFQVALKAVSPKSIIKAKVKIENNTLHVGEQSFPLTENVYLVGFGKAVLEMVVILEEMLGDKLKKGIISVPKASLEAIWYADDKSSFPKLSTDKIEYREGAGDNQPDNDALETTHLILDLVETLTENDTLIVMVSGGGSALLYMPRPSIDQDDKMQLCKSLQNAGANIIEVNTVRKKLSLVKGGGLARVAFPATVISLILSDIVDDPIDLIASGPTVYSAKAPEDVVAILRKYDLFKSLEGDLKSIIIAPEAFNDAPLLTPNKEFKHVTNIIIANNMLAIEAAKREALSKKLTPIVLKNNIQGDVGDVSLAYANLTNLMCLALDKSLKKERFFDEIQKLPILTLGTEKVDEIYDLIRNVDNGGVVLIGGGEPTVVVTGTGKGGRNQELALRFSLDWLAKVKANPQLANYDVVMLSLGTDGQDGPTDAAGAFGHPAIGPILHNMRAKLKSMITKQLLKIEAMKKENDKDRKDKEIPQELCKRYELSDYIMYKQKKEQPKNIESEKEVRLPYLLEEGIKRIEFLNLTLMELERMLPENTLKDNNSYNLFSRFFKGADLVKTGFTGTNVMDLHFVYIRKRQCGCDIEIKKECEQEDFLEQHDLHIDKATIEKYEADRAPMKFRLDSFLMKKKEDMVQKPPERLKLKIIDENMKEPCCNKNRKMPKPKKDY